MRSVRQLGLLAVITLSGSAMLGAQVVLAGGPPPPGFLPAGEYANSFSFAQFRSTTSSGVHVQASVSDRTTVNKPKDAPATNGRQTTLTVQAFGFDPVNGPFFETGCYQISASDWTVAADLSTASVNTAISSSTPTCGPPPNIPTPFTVTLQWTGTGPVASNHSDTTFTCLAYMSVVQRTNSDNIATVSGTISALSDPITSVPSDVSVGMVNTHVRGVVDPTCPPGGGGKGAGPGPQPAGNYQFTNVRDGAVFESTDFTRRIFVSVADNVEVANPLSGPSVTTENVQVDVTITDFTSFPPTFLNGCYVVSPGVLTQNGAQSATLHVVLDPATTPPCPNQFRPNNLPLVTVDASWTASGPVVSTRDSTQTSCSTYTTESTSLNLGAQASDKFTLTPLFTDTFTSPDQGGLTTSDISLHAQGVDPQACIVRG